MELLLAAGILAATGVLVSQPRGPESLAQAQARPVTGRADLGGGRAVVVSVDPGHQGAVSVLVSVTGPEAATTTVRATASLPSAHLGPLAIPLQRNGVAGYSADSVLLPRSGDWVFTLVTGTSSFDATTATVTLHLA